MENTSVSRMKPQLSFTCLKNLTNCLQFPKRSSVLLFGAIDSFINRPPFSFSFDKGTPKTRFPPEAYTFAMPLFISLM